MSFMTSFIIKTLSLLTLGSNIFVVLFLITWVLSKKVNTVQNFLDQVGKTIRQKGTLFAFIVALAATSGSLYFSEGAGFEPCKLCWFQRIFMYPQVFLLGTALVKKAGDVAKYILPLSILGALIAFYHYVMQISPNSLAPCSAIGFSVSCSERFFTYFGYITIPWMSFSAFLLISLFLSVFAKNENKK